MPPRPGSRAAGAGGSRVGSAAAVTLPGVPRRPDRGRSRSETAARVGVLVVLLAVVFALLQLNDKPGIGISIYGLLPIVLAGFLFGPPRGALPRAAALRVFPGGPGPPPRPPFP